MLHAMPKYQDRIVDLEEIIPKDEPVFLLRAQDKVAADTVRAWADLQEKAGGNLGMIHLARDQADKMDAWPVKKLADL